tara:strand:- start:10548 stop:11117 length:570 start_codon:yes stop_codon:yes gene_type:complete
MKLFWFDVETTGLSSSRNDLVQLACLVEEDGKILGEYEFKCKPTGGEINPKALKVTNTTEKELLARPDPHKEFEKLKVFLEKYIDKYKKNDKYIMAGWNTPFDQKFLQAFWYKMGDKWFGSYFEYKVMDVYSLYLCLDCALELSYPNHKLKTVAEAERIALTPHDAIEDIRATRKLFYWAKKKYLKADF